MSSQGAPAWAIGAGRYALGLLLGSTAAFVAFLVLERIDSDDATIAFIFSALRGMAFTLGCGLLLAGLTMLAAAAIGTRGWPSVRGALRRWLVLVFTRGLVAGGLGALIGTVVQGEIGSARGRVGDLGPEAALTVILAAVGVAWGAVEWWSETGRSSTGTLRQPQADVGAGRPARPGPAADRETGGPASPDGADPNGA